MLTIKVINQSSGSPSKGRKVTIGYSGIFGGVTSPEYTDGDGEAHIDTKNGEATVFVDGSIKHKGHLSGRIVVYI